MFAGTFLDLVAELALTRTAKNCFNATPVGGFEHRLRGPGPSFGRAFGDENEQRDARGLRAIRPVIATSLCGHPGDVFAIRTRVPSI